MKIHGLMVMTNSTQSMLQNLKVPHFWWKIHFLPDDVLFNLILWIHVIALTLILNLWFLYVFFNQIFHEPVKTIHFQYVNIKKSTNLKHSHSFIWNWIDLHIGFNELKCGQNLRILELCGNFDLNWEGAKS